MYKISANTLFVGKKYIYLPSCHSTNDIADNFINSGQAVEGLTILTSNQTSGRGQRGNTWETEPDRNLTLSVIFTPNFLNARDQFQLNIAISLGIFDFFSGFLGSGLKVKWPNDIFYQDSKIGGILIENLLKKNLIEYSIVGIGLNINQEEFRIQTASSLRKINRKEYNLETCAELLLEKLEKRYLQLRSGAHEKMKQEYLNVLYKYQEDHTFYDLRSGQKVEFRGQILGINAFGKLAIANQNQEVVYFDFKEVSLVP